MDDAQRQPKMRALVAKAGAQLICRRFVDVSDLKTALYARPGSSRSRRSALPPSGSTLAITMRRSQAKRAGQHSIRLSLAYRAFYTVTGGLVEIVTVIEVNKHKY
jgi:hypothetical protein